MNKSYNYKPSPEEEAEFEEEEQKAARSSAIDTPFNVLMQQAGKLKSKQNEIYRVKYDSYPPWYQHSMFATDEVIEARKMSFSERMKAALSYKERGNISLKKEEFYDAMHDYERGLSVFSWIENLKDDWKKKEIEDHMIKEFDYTPTSHAESETLKTFQCSCLLNLALVYSRQLQWGDVIKACTAALDKDPKSSKAYFRRAQARYLPMYCGATENEIALDDLKKALSLAPEDKLIRREFLKLKSALDIQREKDNKQYGGLFERGRIVEEEGDIKDCLASPQSGTMTVDDAYKYIQDAESACQRYYEDGRLEDAARLQKTVSQLKRDIDGFSAEQHAKIENESKKITRNPFLDIDLSNITSQQIEDAQRSGLDLNDPKVREYVSDIQKELKIQEKRFHSHPKYMSKLSDMKHVMDRLESRKLVDILAKDWKEGDDQVLIKQLLDNRIKYFNEYETPSALDRVEVLTGEIENSKCDLTRNNGSIALMDTDFETLYEYMVDDISVLYSEELAKMGESSLGVDDCKISDRIMDMMDKKYRLREAEKALRRSNRGSWVAYFLYATLGFLLFRFLVFPFYNRFCFAYCTRVDCSKSQLCDPIYEGADEETDMSYTVSDSEF